MFDHGLNINPLKTHCKNGHEFNKENTIYAIVRGKVTQRRCRKCSNNNSKKLLRQLKIDNPEIYKQRINGLVTYLENYNG